MNGGHDTPSLDGISDSEESCNDLEADMYIESAIIPPDSSKKYEEKNYSEENSSYDEFDGSRPRNRKIPTHVEQGEKSEFGIPLDPSDTLKMDKMFNRVGQHYLVYTSCILYLLQKYGALNTRQMALLIGNLNSNQLYEILNVLCQFKIIIRGNKKAGWSCKICTECTVPEPLYDIIKLDEKRDELVDELSSKKKNQ